MAILGRRHGARATTVSSGGSGLREGETWQPAQYLYPRTLDLRRGEAKPITIYYPHTGLLPEPATMGVQTAILTIATASTTAVAGQTEFEVRRTEHRADGHIDVWVFAAASAPLGVHETIFWLNDTAAADTVVRPVRVTIDVVNPGF